MEGIIVVDKIPKNCQECGMYYTSAIGGFGCVVSHRFISQNAANKRKKPDWCPIKPIPMREESGLEYCEDEWTHGFNTGWNKCIDEILKGGKNENIKRP